MIAKISFIAPKTKSYNSNPISQISFKSNNFEQSCDTFIKSDDNQALLDARKAQLASLGLSNAQCLKYYSYDTEKFNKIIKALRVGAKSSELDDVLNLSQKHFERYLDIRQETSNAFQIATFDDERYNKVLDLLKKGVNTFNIYKLSLEPNETFERISKFFENNDDELAENISNEQTLSRCEQIYSLGIKPSQYLNLIRYDDKKYNKALRVYKYAPDPNIESTFLFGMSDELFEQGIELLKEGLDAHSVQLLLYSSGIKAKYEELSKIYNKRCASILACVSDAFYSFAQGATQESLAELINSVSQNTKSAQVDFGKEIFKLCMDNINLEELNSYIKQFDFKKLCKLAPAVKNYAPEELLEFYVYHYKKSDNILDKNTLANKNFEKYLSENLVSAQDLTKFLIKFPLTKREIGNIPDDWLNNLSKDEIYQIDKKINRIILAFMKSRDEEEFNSSMSELLNKNVEISRLPAGAFGKCYRIKMDNASDTCLKLFKSIGASIPNGASFEPQAALFANNNSNKFVKMFFARTAPIGKKDGYIVTQYLDKTIKPIATKKVSGVNVYSEDAAYGSNTIKGKIIDFGAVRVIDLRNKFTDKNKSLDF